MQAGDTPDLHSTFSISAFYTMIIRLLLLVRPFKNETRRKAMVTAIILLNVARERINETAQELSDVKGMSEVFSVSGRYDLVAIARVGGNEELAELVTNKMLKIKGIIGSETMLAFRTYSRHDLEGMFSIGFEE